MCHCRVVQTALFCLQDYLQSLNKKPVKHNLQWDKFGELSDLSADETDNDKKPQKTASTATSSNKFIKKKTEPQSLATSQKPVQTPSKASTTGIQSALGNVQARSSALDKADSFAAKYNVGRGKVTSLPSDSDLELSLSPDEEVLADVQAVKHTTAAIDSHSAVEPGWWMCLLGLQQLTVY